MSWLLVPTSIAALLSCALTVAGLLRARRESGPEIPGKLSALEQALREISSTAREEGRQLRDEVRAALASHQQGLETRLATFAQSQNEQLRAMRQEASDGRAKLDEGLKTATETFSHTQTARLAETNQAMKALGEGMQTAQNNARDLQNLALDGVAAKIQLLTEANDKKQDAIREALTLSLKQLRKDNEAKLEQMRATVDEKLQGTLEARLGDSFKIVSDRLEQVHKGLGEMQTLANGVGDLKLGADQCQVARGVG